MLPPDVPPSTPPVPLAYAGSDDYTRLLAHCASFWPFARVTAGVTLVLLWVVPVFCAVRPWLPGVERVGSILFSVLIVAAIAHVFAARMALPTRHRAREAIVNVAFTMLIWPAAVMLLIFPLALAVSPLRVKNAFDYCTAASLCVIALVCTRPLYRAARNPHPPRLVFP